jgi:hypothetical protein
MLIKKGVIVKGEYENWNISLEYDDIDTGGYYVYIWLNEQGYDDWFETKEAAESFIISTYIVKW